MKELRLVEKYRAVDETRYRFRVGDTGIIINVSGMSEEEALEKARRIAGDLGLLEDDHD